MLPVQFGKRVNIKLKSDGLVILTFLIYAFAYLQIECLIAGQRASSWDTETIWRSLELRCSLSARQYELLRSKNAPLVSKTTLKTWLRDFNVSQGETTCAIQSLGKHVMKLNDREKVAVLMFDEMALMAVLSYDGQKEQILGPHSQLQVVMASSLFGRWKLPVYFQVSQHISQVRFYI